MKIGALSLDLRPSLYTYFSNGTKNSLESWLSLFEFNISLRKIIWRLDSRKSFPINKFLVRNNSIKKFVDEGRDTTDLKVPATANCSLESLKGGTPAAVIADVAE